ncbi:MAG: hypothetical protein IT252_00690 [Chitinophagaceae bacterium]|nr:hypothetical protein [Chitinophagaceae bacterium]
MSFHFLKYKGYRSSGGLFVCAAILLSSCQLIFPFKKKPKLAQLWMIESGSFKLARNCTMLQLNSDSTYTLLSLTGADSGQWIQQNQQVHLQYRAGNIHATNIYFRIKPVKNNQLEFWEYDDDSYADKRTTGMLKVSPMGKHKTANPVAFAMNQWRISPDSAETPAAIKKRTLQYLQFVEACYQFAIDNQLETLPTDWFPQPIQMYFSNGVRMAYANELDDWNSCFFSIEQATQGYMYISSALRKIKLKTTDNKFDRNLDCLQQLIAEITAMEELPPTEESNRKEPDN